MADTATDRVIVYADYVCPFCRLGDATLQEYLAGRADRGLPPLRVEWRPYDLRADERGPDGSIPPEAGADKEAYVRSRWSEVTNLAEEYGVEMQMDVDRYLRIDAKNAQLVALGLKRDDPDRFRPFHDAVYEALWTETRDVGDSGVLRELVAGVDIDPGRVEAWLEDEALQERFASANRVASEHGVRGVPTFVYDGRTLYGSQPPSGYADLLEPVGPDDTPVR